MKFHTILLTPAILCASAMCSHAATLVLYDFETSGARTQATVTPGVTATLLTNVTPETIAYVTDGSNRTPVANDGFTSTGTLAGLCGFRREGGG